jgi:hypothetical protein
MNWATIVPVLLGSGIALATSISVEYLKYKQTTEAATRERENAMYQQSREGLHDLVTKVQDSLEQVILSAGKMLDGAVDDEQYAHFRDVTIRTIRLVSQLPDEKWRNGVKKVISLANSAVASGENGTPDESAKRTWRQAAEEYEEVLDRVAKPIQEFYMLARK